MADIQYGKVLSTGVPGLDEILEGGFAEGETFVVRGGPGTGKTTLALQFLLDGARNGEPSLYIGMGGAAASIDAIAASHGWTLDRRYLRIHEVQIPEDVITAPKRRAFHPSEVGIGETMAGILKEIGSCRPKRVVIDTLAELRLLCEDEMEYRRQFLALRRALMGESPTVIITDYGANHGSQLGLDALCHGSFLLEAAPHSFGVERRRLRAVKYRASKVRSGWHDLVIRTGGMQVFPTLVAAADHRKELSCVIAPSGNRELDTLLGGGLDCGSVTAILGPSGAGKSSLSAQFIAAAAATGRKAAVYLFDETEWSYLKRAEGLGFPLRQHVDNGTVSLRQLDVAEIPPGEFVRTLVSQVEQEGVSLVVIDSLNGYLDTMADEEFLLVQLHELFTFLNRRAVTTILTVVQHGLFGTPPEPVAVSYIADNVILLRFFEYRGEIRLALSALKMRRSMHERTIREIRFSGSGIALSEPLPRMQGILTGVPTVGQERGGQE